MRNSTDIFARLLERFKLRESVADDVQRMILARRRDALAMTLRAVNDYSAWYGMVLRAYFGARRAGLRISVGASKAIVVTLGAMLMTALVAFLFYAVHTPIGTGWSSGVLEKSGSDVIEQDKIINSNNKNELHKKYDEKNCNDNKKSPSPACRIGVAAFTGGGDAGGVTRVIADTLVRLKGPSKVIRLDRRGGKTAPMILMGSVETLGGTCIITSRIVDVEKGTVVFSTSESVNTQDKIKRAAETIAERIAARIE